MSNPGRDPPKRKVKPVEPQSLLDLEIYEGESSDDSDFRIEDHPEESDDYSINSDDDAKKQNNKSDSSDSGSESEDGFKNSSTKLGEGNSIAYLLEKAKNQEFKFPGELANLLICAGCLGSRSDDFNEIVECDGCGVTVHEGCYGVSDVTSESSTVSSASTEPWFCEACKAGVKDPNCELCPNKGGIFKETEVGAWVHLVCALYVPGVAFSEVERLSGVTLFEMAYSRWGARACGLCSDATLARTGVAIGCDAGLCKTFFHVTCGQREGLLAEAHSEEAEQADPFYAHCKMHSDKTLIKKRKRNWLALQLRTELRKQELINNLSTDDQLRIQRKLVKYRRKYLQQKENRNPPWVPTQKMARMLYSSASAMRKFQRKAECMGIDTHALEFQDAQMAALKDVSRRWHVPPAFSVEFVGYYLERNSRVSSLRVSLERLTKENEKLLSGDEKLRTDYDEANTENTSAVAEMTLNRDKLKKMYDAITALCPNKVEPEILQNKPLLPPPLLRPTPKVTPQQLQKRSMCVPTAAALKMGVGFPLSDNPDARQGKVLSTSMEANHVAGAGAAGGAGLAARECAVCARSSERHLMASCDTCRQHYHLHCLKPPLQRPPKKSKLYGWQCSECDKTSDSEPEIMEKKVLRRSRIRYSKDGAIITEPSSPTLDSPPMKAKSSKNMQCSECDKTSDSEPEVMEKKVPRRSRIRYSKDGAIITEPSSPTLDSPPMKAKSSKPKPEKPKPLKLITTAPEMLSPIKVTIKPFEFTSDDGDSADTKARKKLKKLKQKEIATPSAGEADSPTKKQHKRSFTSPTLTNTPLMSITPIVAESPNDSHNENSNASNIGGSAKREDSSFLSPNSSFSSLLTEAKVKERDSKTIENSIETTLANLSSDIATYKANRKRRKEKHRSRYSPDLLRTPKHKHKRKKKNQDMENPGLPRITIKIKPIPKPEGSVGTQMFYVPTDSNDGPPPAVIKKISKHGVENINKPQVTAPETPAEQVNPEVLLTKIPDVPKTAPKEPVPKKPKLAERERLSRRRQSVVGRPPPTSELPPMKQCDVCTQAGDAANLVRCDECFKRYHFTCLEPPLNKNPKKRGYSWHCADCDPTDVEENN